MTLHTTPGQRAYEAYCRVTYGHAAHPADYHTLERGPRAAWEAAARAGHQEPPGVQFRVGQHVRRTLDPEHIWEILWRSVHEEAAMTSLAYGLRLVDPASTFHPCRMSDGSDLTPVEETP